MAIYTQNFDGNGTTLPTGWSWPSEYTIQGSPYPTGISPVSPSYMLKARTASNQALYGTYQTLDGVSGAVSCQVYANTPSASSSSQVGVQFRQQSSTPGLTGGTCYLALWSPGTPSAQLYRNNGGSWTQLGSTVTPSPAPSVPGWYLVIGSADASDVVSLYVQERSTGYWLQPGGSWSPAKVACVSVTDASPITGQGYSGTYASTGTDSFYLDSFELDALTGTTTVLYAIDLGTAAESWLLAAQAGDAGTTTLAPLTLPIGVTDAGLGPDGSLAWLGTGDAGAADGSAVATTFVGGSIYAADGGTAASVELVAPIGGDVSLDTEFAAVSLAMVGLDAGSAASAGVTTVQASVAYVALDPAFGSESAPAPTAFDTDAASAYAAALVASLGGESGSASVGLADMATASETWSITTLLLAVDAGHPAEYFAATVVITTSGYFVYSNTGSGDAINYATPIAEIDSLATTTWTSSPLAVPGDWKFAVRAFNPYGIEHNLDCYVEVIFDARGVDITNIPVAPTNLRAIARVGGKIQVIWSAGQASTPAKRATSFNVYMSAGSTLDYTTPVATVQANAAIIGAFQSIVQGVDGTQYKIGVRAVNATGTEQNTSTVSITADGTGPGPVSNLTLTPTA